MKRQNLLAFTVALALAVVVPSPALANPIPPTGAQSVFMLAILALPLVAEVIVTMLLLKKYRFSVRKLGIAYFVINVASFGLFLRKILPAFGPLLGELFVVLLETACLFTLLNLNWFRTEETTDPSLKATSTAVAVGNLTSLFSGFPVLSLFVNASSLFRSL